MPARPSNMSGEVWKQVKAQLYQTVFEKLLDSLNIYKHGAYFDHARVQRRLVMG
jgi:hypothetical protein